MRAGKWQVEGVQVDKYIISPNVARSRQMHKIFCEPLFFELNRCQPLAELVNWPDGGCQTGHLAREFIGYI